MRGESVALRKGWRALILLKSWLLVSLTCVIASFSICSAGQAAPKVDERQVADAIKRVESDDLGVGPVDALSFVDLIAAARAVQGLPVLEQYFSRTLDPGIKAGTASALVRMGDKNDTYWTYLVVLATPASESDAPYPFLEAAGKENIRFSPEFQAWANTRKLSLEAAFKLAWYDLPGNLAPLAKTGDPRGIPLLRKALVSSNLMIASLGAAGLAQAHDTSSVPMIIEACKRLPASMAHFLADPLKFFDDPQAERTFAFYFPDVNIEEARKFNGYSPFGPRYTIER